MNRVTEEIQSKANQISSLCERYYVRRLELFGSAANGKFDPNTSDLDFLVEFGMVPVGKKFDSYFGLLESLESMFNRKVDIVEVRAIRNPYFLEFVQKNPRIVVYGSQDKSLFA